MAPTFGNEKSPSADDIVTITKELHYLSWTESITNIDLSNKEIIELDESIKFPSNLLLLNLSNNLLEYVPESVCNLTSLQQLDLSYNKIIYFDEKPKFCNTIEKLYLNNNNLHGPPFWIWNDSPINLNTLDISHNTNILYSLCDEYEQQFSKCVCSVNEIKLNNCKLNNAIEFLKTIQKVKTLIFSTHNVSAFSNKLQDFPGNSFLKCCDIERIFLCNTDMFDITNNIKCFKKLKEVDLSMNNICNLPIEFCELESLETCFLSYNQLLYLPDSFTKLKSLKYLDLENNKLCMLPDLTDLPNLRHLDVYNNKIDHDIKGYENIETLDFAQNFFAEPENAVYLEKKEKLRLTKCANENRVDGNKIQDDEEADERSHSEDEEYDNDPSELRQATTVNEAVSDEDWDSDDYWEPNFFVRYNTEPRKNAWLQFVEQKMREGNLCPMDWHTIPIMDQIRYYRQLYPEPPYIPAEGQFDDPEE